MIAGASKAPGFAGGYRVVSNCGADAGQTVDHIHFHLLAGRRCWALAIRADSFSFPHHIER